MIKVVKSINLTTFVYTNFVMTSIELNKKLNVSLLRAGIKINDELSAFMKPYELTLPQFNVLRILRGQKGKAANLSTVNQRMIHKMSNTTRIIDKLIEKELVKRIICQNNRRKIELFITKKGQMILADIDDALDAKEGKLVQSLNQIEKEKLHALLLKLL